MHLQHPHPPAQGFTLIELMIVVAIISIMATMAMPSYQDRVIRAQVGEGLALAEFVKQAVAAHRTGQQHLPADNAAAALPPAESIVGNHVSAVAVQGGAIQIRFGNNANRNLAGKTLSLRPATVQAHPQVPIAWVCGQATVPKGMVATGRNATDLPAAHLPLDCRPGPAA